METRKEIKQKKIELYRLLLKLEENDITDNEIDIMYLLAKDKDIQEKLGK